MEYVSQDDGVCRFARHLDASVIGRTQHVRAIDKDAQIALSRERKASLTQCGADRSTSHQEQEAFFDHRARMGVKLRT